MNITNIIRGDSQLFIPTVTSNNVPVNITNYEVFFTVNPSTDPTDDSGAIIEKSVTPTTTQVILFNGINYTINPAQGQAAIQLSNTDTQNLVPGGYFFDVQVKDLVGNIVSLKQGNFTIIPDITRRIT